MAEWLRSGLQIRVPRFDSGRGLHLIQLIKFVAQIGLRAPQIGALAHKAMPLASRTTEARSSGETGPLVREQRGKASVRAHWRSTFELMQFRPFGQTPVNSRTFER